MQIQLKANKESNFSILNFHKKHFVCVREEKINKPRMILIYVITWEWKETQPLKPTEHENANT